MPAPPRRPPPAATTSPPRSSTSAPPSPPLTSGRRPTRWWAGVPGLGLVSLLPVAPALAHHGRGEQDVLGLRSSASSKGGSPRNGGGVGAMSAPPPWPAMVGELLTIGEQTVGLLRIAESQVAYLGRMLVR
ncbi:hypothetical protein OsI_12962 [Oryza sativa Indica Group]|uniref:Uncharacterized protein n=1 Tax=Oryza sativa subsp. indica TaxID=39946 RepID=B8AP40_ORYSI|nr:hypothetical protein OsI_12962 [Oryza sativa Indica Group]